MSEPPTDPPLIEPAPDRTPGDVIRALGYDPEAIQSLVVTPTHVVAVAADYPEPQTKEG